MKENNLNHNLKNQLNNILDEAEKSLNQNNCTLHCFREEINKLFEV